MSQLPILSIVIWLPALVGVLLIVAVRSRQTARWLALLTSLVTFGVSLQLYAGFDTSTAAMQFVEHRSWIPGLNINYALGIDGIALPLILLTTFISVLVFISGWSVIQSRVQQYLGAFLILQGFMSGVFAALDGVLFYVFFEGMLVPMFLIIGIWGGPNRVYATLKFFLYTFFGSVFTLIALVYLYFSSGTWVIAEWYVMPLSLTEQTWIFLALLVAFAVKVPMWPVHTWLPDAHVEAPTGGSVVLAAVMLKVGGYGFLRFSLPITPDASSELAWLVIGLSLVAVVYIGFVALAQDDLKKLIAYSSIAHMGFVTLGTFAIYMIARQNSGMQGAVLGLEGAMVQMISHGLISGALFLCVGVLYDRMHSRMISDYGGVVNTMPWFAALLVLFAMANAGLPGTSGFVGEFMVIMASFKANVWYAVLAATTLVLGAAYTLWMVKRVVFGDVGNERVATLTDINGREALVLGSLAVGVVLLGVWPDPLVEVMHASVDQLLNQATQSKLAVTIVQGG
ncbi:MAG: NADH-quinone oxidoreductase subunit M [Gammaproteobacteria bacterium]|nr:MAG: NADH-quinone oxidoreductase subunit M [Gammaproteobacteria bacterium]